MGSYTESLENLFNIEPEDEEQLQKVAQSFRSFGEALDTFLQQHGFTGIIEDTESKVAYIKDQFRQAKIPPISRTIKKYFEKNVFIKDKSVAYRFCFAFHLDINETHDFFRKTCLMRAFDCHDITEVIYYYAIRNGLAYSEAQSIIAESPAMDLPEGNKEPIDYQKGALYTSKIVEHVDHFTNKKDFLTYLNENSARFLYNNATSSAYFREIWKRISATDGLANKEMALKVEKKFIFKERSTWVLLNQILGFDDENDPNGTKPQLFKNPGTDRSMKFFLEGNKLLHSIAAYCFPFRFGIQNIINGRHVSDELIRKTLILLVFYKFWVSKSIDKKTLYYYATDEDKDEFFDEINRFLRESGYPELYAGNPYDWLFLYCTQKDYPLDTLRRFMLELFIVYQQENVASDR